MNIVIHNDAILSTKLILIVKDAFQFIKNENFYLDIDYTKFLVRNTFNRNNNIENHIVNTYNYYLDSICKDKDENKIIIGDFIYEIVFAILNSITYKNPQVLENLKNLPVILKGSFGDNTLKKIDEEDKAQMIKIINIYFSKHPIIFLNENISDIYRKIYLNALESTFKNAIENYKFHTFFVYYLAVYFETSILENKILGEYLIKHKL
jgi:hypothetical protein